MNYRHFLELFNEIVERQPDKTAILVEGRQAYSYLQLNQKALRIAKLLRDAGVSEGMVVGIGISKSAEYIASMLGVWYARAAFLPLDPELPAERCQFIVKQSGMLALLVKPAGKSVFEHLLNGGTSDLTQPLPAPFLVTVDGDWASTAASSGAGNPDQTNPDEATADASYAVSPDHLAYIIYTSGSTGRPKGVMVPHSGIANFIEAQIEAFKLNAGSKALFFLSTNFDASVSDIGTALLSGGTLCIEPQGLLRPGPHFMPLLSERNITHIDIPPSVLRTLDPADKPDSLETIIIGGEACAPDVVRGWAAKCLVVNVYGPTEATVCTSLGACDPVTWGRPLIGQPIEGVEYLVLDEEGERSKAGTPGELYIGGISLALGYVDEPELTARKFVTLHGQRLYRTGDQVILHDDGEFEFLGRVDRQFKLRGMLVEPEEIEAKIAAHPEVARVAVLKRPARSPVVDGVEHVGGADKLVAFVALNPGSTLDSDGLKKHLMRSVPPWMVPAIFEFINELPSTLTGKVDFSKLREAPLSAYRNRSSSRALTPTQSVLVEVWKQVFGLQSVSIEDDFYELGGDSLNIVEAVVAAHIRGLTINPELIAAYSTVADLSREIDEAQGERHAVDGLESGMSSRTIRQEIKPEVDTLRHGIARVSESKDLSSAQKEQSATSPAQSVASPAQSLASIELPENRIDQRRPAKIFLTGATGFLGSRLLDELLSHSNAEVYCLVRCDSQSAGMKRIRRALGFHQKKLTEEQESKIVIVRGTLDKPRLGLDINQWEELATKVDTIIHCGAAVNMVKNYFELRPVNLEGTAHIASLWLEGKPKSLHYASTLSVFVATSNNTGVAMESDALADDCTVYGGYAQTKVACEHLLRSIEDAAVMPVSYYRFGLLTGDSLTGCSARDDFLNMFIRGITALGCAPESDANVTVDITPVDFAARAMAHLVLKGAVDRASKSAADCVSSKGAVQSHSSTYHIANQRSLSLPDLLDFIRDFGVAIKSVTAQEFLSRLQEKSSKLTAAESAACLALCRSLGDAESFERFRTMDLFQATDIRFDCTNTIAALEGTGIFCPEPSLELIQKYIAALLRPTATPTV